MSTMSSLAIQPLYDKIGATYDATRHAEPAILDVLSELLDLEHGADVLDIGCGTGNYTTALGERGYEMLGIDRSGLMLRTARAKAPGLPLIGADAANLPFSNRTFDGAVAAAGPGLADILWRVVCAGEGMRDAETALGWPARAGKLVLTFALDRVADYYRIR